MSQKLSPGEAAQGNPNQTQTDPTKTKNCASPVEYHPTLVDSPFFLVSVLRQLQDRWREPIPRLPKELFLEARNLPVTEMLPWYRNLPNQVRLLFEKPQPSRVKLTSQPIEVRNIWQDYQWQPSSLLNSVLFHALVVAALTIPFVLTRPKPVTADAGTFSRLYFSPADVPALQRAGKQSHGGGGGGDRSPTPASRGRLPRFARLQLVPPSAIAYVATPKLAVTPTLIGPPELLLPQMQAQVNWGDPNGPISAPSNGPGWRGGIGDGDKGGVGIGEGPSYGPDDGPYSPGIGGVTAPKPVYSPAPSYSEDARKAKLQGTVMLSLVVDAHGNPTDIHVVRSLGMGLDESAIEKTRTWRFTPGTRNGVPVTVRVVLEVTFRLF
ncbi:MAG: energy transducer TonB [Terriglobia bacterium]